VILAEAEKAVEAFGSLGLVQAANIYTEAQKNALAPQPVATQSATTTVSA
jgi:hypothetical protein